MRPAIQSAYGVSGRVVDLQGRGVPGVTITAVEISRVAVTDSSGRWHLDGLEGPATIVPHKPGASFEPVARSVVPGTTNLEFRTLHPIMGEAVVSREQARRWLQMRGVAESWLDLVDLYYDIAPLYGVRADVALAQAAHETGYWRFGKLVQPWQNNFAGIGATGAASDGSTPLNGADSRYVRFERGVHGAIFSTPEAGVEAHIQHLYAYATTAPLPPGRPLISPRFTLVRRGTAPYVEYLGARQNPAGVGWATDAEYGFKIINNFLMPMLEAVPPHS